MLKQIRLMIYLSITCLFTVLIVACGSSDGGAAQQTISLKPADSGKTVTVRQNDLITVTLDGNPTTGYGWSVASGTGSVLTQEGEVKYTPNSSDPMVVGGGGTYLFTFKAAQTGTAPLKLIYSQPWNNNLPAQSFEVTVTVN